MTYINFYFNPRTHKECDSHSTKQYGQTKLFQSTHSQRVRPKYYQNQANYYHISIHALTKSATVLFSTRIEVAHISIHALTKSATTKIVTNKHVFKNFNPRTHKERDGIRYCQLLFSKYFNPRTHKECDAMDTAFKRRFSYFNPRTHKECDRSLSTTPY